MSDLKTERPWFQQPFVWMLIVIPASAVFAGFYTFYLAVVSFDGMVVDDYYKHGKEINRVLKRDHQAASLGLAADVSVNRIHTGIEIKLVSNPGFRFPDRLRLRFLHTTRAGYDQELAVIHKGRGAYVGVLPVLKPGSWHVLLETGEWRLSGLLPTADSPGAKLSPAV